MNLLNNWYKHYRWRSSPLNPQRDVARLSIDQLYERLHTMFGHEFFEIPEPTKIGTMSTNWLHYLLAGRGNSSLVPLWEFHTLVEVAEKYFPDIHKRLMSYKKDTLKMQDTLFEVFAARWLNHNNTLVAVEPVFGNQTLDGVCSINGRHFIYECKKLRSVSMDTIRALLDVQVYFAQYLNKVKYASPVSCVVLLKQKSKKTKNAVINGLRKFFASQEFKTGRFQKQTITTPSFELIIAPFTYGMEASDTFKNNIPRIHIDIIPPNKYNKEGLTYHPARFRVDFTLTQDYINEKFIEHISKKRKQHRKNSDKPRLFLFDSEHLNDMNLPISPLPHTIEQEPVEKYLNSKNTDDVVCIIYRNYRKSLPEFTVKAYAPEHMQAYARHLEKFGFHQDYDVARSSADITAKLASLSRYRVRKHGSSESF